MPACAHYSRNLARSRRYRRVTQQCILEGNQLPRAAFFVTLSHRPHPTVSMENTDRMPRQILVVDDEPDLELLVRQRFRRQIRDRELEFFFSHNGEEALAALAGQPSIDLVLSDINMPVM